MGKIDKVFWFFNSKYEGIKMATNLDEVKAELYKIFNEAVKRHGLYSDPNSAENGTSYGGGNPENFAIQNRQAIGALGLAIAEVEREQRAAKERPPVRMIEK